MALHEIDGDLRGRFEVAGRLGSEGHRDGWDAEQEPFGRGGHGARVDRVVAHVGAEIDARNHHIRQLVEKAGHCQMHAISRRAIDEKEAVGRAPNR